MKSIKKLLEELNILEVDVRSTLNSNNSPVQNCNGGNMVDPTKFKGISKAELDKEKKKKKKLKQEEAGTSTASVAINTDIPSKKKGK